jgi:hypothetical protein
MNLFNYCCHLSLFLDPEYWATTFLKSLIMIISNTKKLFGEGDLGALFLRVRWLITSFPALFIECDMLDVLTQDVLLFQRMRGQAPV